MKKIIAILSFTIVVSLPSYHIAVAQCAMCKASAETSLKEGNKSAAGLNSGIMYMLLMPYLLVGGIGYYWYINNKKKKAGETEPANLT